MDHTRFLLQLLVGHKKSLLSFVGSVSLMVAQQSKITVIHMLLGGHVIVNVLNYFALEGANLSRTINI